MTRIEVSIPEKIDVGQDKKTKAKYITIPLEYEDGVPGAIVLMKLQKSDWSPHKEIVKIIIETR